MCSLGSTTLRVSDGTLPPPWGSFGGSTGNSPPTTGCTTSSSGEGAPCHLYYDVEFQTEPNPGVDGQALVDLLLKVVAEQLRGKLRGPWEAGTGGTRCGDGLIH